jgi:hypothetical protein
LSGLLLKLNQHRARSIGTLRDVELSRAALAGELAFGGGGKTRMGLFDWFRRRPQTETADQHVVKNVPALSEPILLFMENTGFVTGLAVVPSWQVVHARSFEEFIEVLPKQKYAMLIALSPSDDSGAAARAIQAFRVPNPDALTVYHGTDYRLAISGPRALACGADVLMVGGVLAWNLIYCLGTALLLKSRQGIEPSTEFYAKLLQVTCAESPFWSLQDANLPVCEIE